MIGGAVSSNMSTSSDNFQSLWGADSNATEANVEATMPLAGTLSDFYVRVSQAPGTGNSWTFTVRKNGADEAALQCPISGSSAVTCSDTAGTVSYAVGDRIAIRSDPDSGPNAAIMHWTAQYTP